MALAVLTTVAWAPGAGAQVLPRLVLRGELGAGTMLSEYQRNEDPRRFFGNVKGYGLGLQATVRVGVTVGGPVAVQLSLANWFFPAERQAGQVLAPMAGVRIEPRAGRLGRIFVDGNAGAAFTGTDRRFTFDVGVGFELDLSRSVALGPVVRYGHVVQPDDGDASNVAFPEDARYWSAGLSLALRGPERRPPPPPPPQDTDHDGLLDPVDRCPTEPETPNGFEDDDGCPDDNDPDHDGITNDRDRCPAEPEDRDGHQDDDGCPDPDNDGDGIPDATDRCPGEPETCNGLQDDDGCPETTPALASVEGTQVHTFQRINFANDSDRIVGAASFRVLDAVVGLLRANPWIARLEVQGHTDNRGSAAHNRDLSMRRAESVRRYLDEHGIPSARTTAQGLGPDHPLQPNTTARGRAANRRVEFHLVETTPRP